MREAFAANQRIIALQALEQDSAWELSTQMLQRALEHFGHALSAVAVDGLVDWLTERDLVTVRKLGELAGGLRVAKLTQAGLDVAQGRQRVTGVDRPLPV